MTPLLLEQIQVADMSFDPACCGINDVLISEKVQQLNMSNTLAVATLRSELDHMLALDSRTAVTRIRVGINGLNRNVMNTFANRYESHYINGQKDFEHFPVVDPMITSTIMHLYH